MILTRYLYNYFQVNCSIFLALLDGKEEEVLFWCYELYYSGFQEEVFEYLISLYNTLYITHKTIKDEITQRYHYWKEHQEEHGILGEVVCNLIKYKYSICKIIKKFNKNIKCKDAKVKCKYSSKYTRLTDEEKQNLVALYSTKRNSQFYWKTMKCVCKYKIRNNINALCEEPITYSLKDWSNNWLKYVLETPLWQERIEKYGGSYDIERKVVKFNTLDDEEEFHNYYDLEPDEQSKEIQENCLGCSDDFQHTLTSLIENYGGLVE